MTKQEFLDRCANAWDAGLATPERLGLLARWVDAVLRLEGGQTRRWAEFLADECQRCPVNSYGGIGCLASDTDGYALVQLGAILTHPCQACATDPKAWWTRSAFCEHKEGA